MGKQQPTVNNVLLRFASFFEAALKIVGPPYMKLFVVLGVVVLLALLLVKDQVDPGLGLELVVAVVLVFAFLVAILQYVEMRFRYSKRTEEELKKALREAVTELEEARARSVSSETRKAHSKN